MFTHSVPSFLRGFNEDRNFFVIGDDATTTWESVGAIFLTIASAQDTTVESLHKITGFTRSFVMRALALIEQKSWLASLEFAKLVISVRDPNHQDFSEMDRALDNLMMSFWEQSDREQLELLKELRGGLLFGGLTQWWTDEENDPVAAGFLLLDESVYET